MIAALIKEGVRGRWGERETRWFSPMVIFLLLCLSSTLEAQTPLRWNLKPGQSFGLHSHQETDSEVGFSGKSAKTTISNDLYLTWKVTTTDDEAITIHQTIDRIVVNIVARDAATIEYDSAATGRPSGQAASLASGLKPLLGAEFKIKMDRRGKVLTAEPINEAAKSLMEMTNQLQASDAAARGSLQRLLKQPLVVLPEKEVSAGDSWTHSSELETSAGPMRQETTYQLEKIYDEDGKQMCQIQATSKLHPSAAAGKTPESKLKIASQDQSAMIQFSATGGRLFNIDQTQKLETLRVYRETTISVKLNSTQQTTLTPNP